MNSLCATVNCCLNQDVLRVLCDCVVNHPLRVKLSGVLKSGGRCCEQDYFGLSGLWTAERAGGRPKTAQRGEGEHSGTETG